MKMDNKTVLKIRAMGVEGGGNINYDKDDAFKVVLETKLVEPAIDENGFIYTNENGVIYSII